MTLSLTIFNFLNSHLFIAGPPLFPKHQPCAPFLQDCRIYRNPPYGKLNFAVIVLGLSKFPVLDFAFFLSWDFDSIISKLLLLRILDIFSEPFYLMLNVT